MYLTKETKACTKIYIIPKCFFVQCLFFDGGLENFKKGREFV